MVTAIFEKRSEEAQALLAQGGLYAGMWNRQREAEAARETAGAEVTVTAKEREERIQRRGSAKHADSDKNDCDSGRSFPPHMHNSKKR